MDVRMWLNHRVGYSFVDPVNAVFSICSAYNLTATKKITCNSFVTRKQTATNVDVLEYALNNSLIIRIFLHVVKVFYLF